MVVVSGMSSGNTSSATTTTTDAMLFLGAGV